MAVLHKFHPSNLGMTSTVNPVNLVQILRAVYVVLHNIFFMCCYLLLLNVRVSQPSQGWTVDMATRLSQLKPSPLHCVSLPAAWNRARTHSPSKESWSDSIRLPARFWGRFAQLRMELEDGGFWVRGGSQNVSVSLFGVLRSMWTTESWSVSQALKYYHSDCSYRSLTHEPHPASLAKAQTLLSVSSH